MFLIVSVSLGDRTLYFTKVSFSRSTKDIWTGEVCKIIYIYVLFRHQAFWSWHFPTGDFY